ncbi:MAG: fumarylacetoacetate hydrolase family protein [Gammaproteobacteria bacterium]|nr:fumarylacetoacetate hydrolase family protein [Gammaproteobacteria bacterium]MDE2249949.1 fumarylacetoacetate hydrolase family protein [Gammaproteobacteria bacterium]
MKLVSCSEAGRVFAGWWREARVLDLAAAGRHINEAADLGSMLAIIRGGDGARAALQRIASRSEEFADVWLDAGRLQFLAPIPVPIRNVFCVGRNYVDHVKEGYARAGKEARLPEVPQFFTKATGAVNSPDGEVRLDPRLTRLLDYEVELAVVIGRGGRDIDATRAHEHVFGYTVANDFTARDLQRRHEQWFKGKSLDTTCPLGPCIVERAEIADPARLELSLSVNGEERQRAHAAQMIFDIPTIIAALSAGLTLEPGDIILTGTPAGVGYAMDPPQALRDGDLVVSRIEGIGELRNRIVAVRRA